MHSEEYGYSKSVQGWSTGTAVVQHGAWKLGRVGKFVLCQWEVCVQLQLPQHFSVLNANIHMTSSPP